MTRIVEESEARIRLRSRPPTWLTSLLWISLISYVAWVCPSHQLTLRRDPGGAVQVHADQVLFGMTLSSRMIRGVTSAAIERPRQIPLHSRDRGGGGMILTFDDTSRVVFATSNGPVPLTKSYSAGLGLHQRVVEEVNGFLQAESPGSTRIPVPNSGWIWAVAGFLAFCAVGLLVGAGCDCLIDRERDLVRMTWPGIPRRGQADYRLSEVERFQVAQLEIGPGGRGRSNAAQFSLGMRLRGGDEISLTRQSSSRLSPALETMAARLERFRRKAGSG